MTLQEAVLDLAEKVGRCTLYGPADAARESIDRAVKLAKVETLKENCDARFIERLALCPDHRDKGTGDRCIVCKFEESARREARRRA